MIVMAEPNALPPPDLPVHPVVVSTEAEYEKTPSQQALELRKFFEPFYPVPGANVGLKAAIYSDGVLDAFAETVVWRLRGVRAMVSLIDRMTQYFLAGATRLGEGNTEEMSHERAWFGCSTVPTPGGLCENTLTVNGTESMYPCFIVNDLNKDERFCHLPVVDGSIMAYRFYAGAPITTHNGVNIGSFFMFDDKPRSEGLSLSQRKFLRQAAANVMTYLETKREAAERRRVALMSNGIAQFLETTSRVTESDLDATDVSEDLATMEASGGLSSIASASIEAHPKDRDTENSKSDDETTKSPSAGVLNQIKLTLDHAAEIIRESLELKVGGVLFLDTALGSRHAGSPGSYFDTNTSGTKTEEPYSPEGTFLRGESSPGQVRAFHDQYQPAKVLAMSVSENVHWTASTTTPDGKTLQNLTRLYSKGNIWYFDDGGYFSSIEQSHPVNSNPATTTSVRRRSRPLIDTARQTTEANKLMGTFENAKQIIFLPLWDAGSNRWYSGCFVWSQSAVPVFTVDSEISFLSAFTNSMMVEISRLEAITANKMKSDFISSISHEFRSPLHGILASTDFLRDSELDSMQAEFISTIQNCGSTLLDTINHVLDYSKINSFEKKGRDTGALSNELYQISNVALLCEEIVYGMMAAKEFQGITEPSTPQKFAHFRSTVVHEPRVRIILDFENRDWNYWIQSGALRRIIMNIFGNANKYTDHGFIVVQLRILQVEMRDLETGKLSIQHTLVLKILDSGRGMSTEYMERKLYTPFAQEDSFANGVGLGLSIVWSIVNQLGGIIHIRSELGKGTDVEVNLPLERGSPSEEKSAMAQSDVEVYGSLEAQQCLENVRKIASGKTVSILRGTVSKSNEQSHYSQGWQCLERYFSTWFGFTIINPESSLSSLGADLVVAEKAAQSLSSPFLTGLDTRRLLLIHEGMTYTHERKANLQQFSVESIWNPIGPYKLARAVSALFRTPPAAREVTVNKIPPLAPLEVTSGFLTFLPSSSTSSVISTPFSSIKGGGVDNIDENDYQAEKSQGSAAITPRSGNFHKLEPLRISAVNTTAAILQSPAVDHVAAQILQTMQALPKPTSPPPSSPNPTSTPTTHSPKPPSSISSGPLHVLAVDDNTLNLQLLHRFLHKRAQDTVVTARNGIEAVAAVRSATARTFDVIFMDLSMPEMDGFEATRLIRTFERSLRHREKSEKGEAGVSLTKYLGNAAGAVADDRNLESIDSIGDRVGSRVVSTAKSSAPQQVHAYIVALTGLASRRDRDKAEESGFDDFLTKPISFGRIGEILARLSAAKGVGDM